MQAQVQLMTTTRQKLMTAAVVAFLAAMVMVPAARATSLVPEGEVATGEAAARSIEENADMSQEQIQFIEDNWYLYIDSPDAGDNPAAIEPDTDDQADELRPQNVEEFEAMERAPGLYTESPDAGSPAWDDSVDAGLTHDEMKFLEDNWHLSPDVAIVEDEDDAGTASGNPSLSREQIQFDEDNWNIDRADVLDELQNGDDEVDDDRSHDELTYPWGGFREND